MRTLLVYLAVLLIAAACAQQARGAILEVFPIPYPAQLS
jgi:hypothetical protein